MEHKEFNFNFNLRIPWPSRSGTPIFSSSRHFPPTPGNLLFTLLLVLALFWAQTAGALPLGVPQSAIQNSQSTIPYQGRLADADGNPLTDTVNIIFRLYGQASDGVPT